MAKPINGILKKNNVDNNGLLVQGLSNSTKPFTIGICFCIQCILFCWVYCVPSLQDSQIVSVETVQRTVKEKSPDFVIQGSKQLLFLYLVFKIKISLITATE